MEGGLPMKVYSTYSVKIKHYNKIFAETVAVYRSAVDYLINVVADEWDVVKDVEGSQARMRCVESLCHGTCISRYSSCNESSVSPQ